MKFFAILPATLFAASPVLAGPYVNVENNAGFSGSNFIWACYRFPSWLRRSGNGYSSYYVQAGPSIFAPDGGEEETKLTGKLGGSVQATERLSVYGEVAATFDDVNDYGTKVGVKYSF